MFSHAYIHIYLHGNDISLSLCLKKNTAFVSVSGTNVTNLHSNSNSRKDKNVLVHLLDQCVDLD